MSKRQAAEFDSRARRVGAVAAAGALPLAAMLLAAAPAAAEPAATAPQVNVSRNSPAGSRAIPAPAPLAAVDAGRLHLPDPSRADVVAPIAPPPGRLRFGDTQVDIPAWLPAQQAGQINDASAQAEARLAGTLDSAGFAPSRSDRIAARTVGTAAVGAAVGAAVTSPLAVAGALLGGFAGTMAGLPMFPLGTLAVTAAGATAGAAIVSAPSAAAGAAIGAAVGMVDGITAPAADSPDAVLPGGAA